MEVRSLAVPVTRCAILLLLLCVVMQAQAAPPSHLAVAGGACAAMALPCLGIGFALDATADRRYEEFLHTSYYDEESREADMERVRDSARDAAFWKNAGIALACAGAGFVIADFLFPAFGKSPNARLEISARRVALALELRR